LLEAAYNNIFKIFDKRLLEIVGPYGLSALFLRVGFNLKFDIDGEPYKYGGLMFFCCTILIFLYHFYI